MSRRSRQWAILSLGWLIMLIGLGSAAWQQKTHLNLSRTAGGQYPYLKYAEGIAQQGVFSFLGDRNRMPVVPAITALAFDKNPDKFFDHATTLAILTSLVALVIVATLAYRRLPLLPASAFTLTAAVCLFLNKASFVQAELLYYSLLFATWLLLCKLLDKPGAGTAVTAGVFLGITYLTKGSALGLLVAYLTVSLGYIVCVLMRKYRRPGRAVDPREKPNLVRHVWSTGMVIALFLSVAGSYLYTNHQRFGTYFYNVNSTFFVWCDNWQAAKSFADSYPIDTQCPQALASDIPGPGNYWRSHTLAQMGQRLLYGLKTLSSLAIRSAFAKYLGILAMVAAWLALTHSQRTREVVRAHRLGLVFTLLTLCGYLIAYAWYVPVAYGDRFLLSLVLPVMFALWWLATQLTRTSAPLHIASIRVSITDALASVFLLALLAEGGLVAASEASTPTKNFIRFYYNESREAQLTGDVGEAVRGYEGILQLDPSHVAAHRELGMVALRAGDFERARQHLQQAVALRPGDADLHNSLGSALLQAGRAKQALAGFREAVQLNPKHASAWYNLGGTYYRLGQKGKAELAVEQLKKLDPRRAVQLQQLLDSTRPDHNRENNAP